LYVPIALYDEEIPSDFASDYAAGLMLSTLQTGSYRPVEYQVASELLLAWMRGATLERPYAKEKYQYCVNLHDDVAAVRIREFKRDADYRYWRTDYLSQHLQSVLIAFQEKNLPHGHPIKKLGTTRSIYGFIKKLALEWSPVHYQRQRRHAARASIEKTIEVAAGLEQVCKVLAKFSNNKYADTSTVTLSMNTSSADPNFTIPQTSETWTVIDESNTGFGVVMGMHPSAWIESGKLVGFKHPNQADVYVVAEIKNFRKQKNSIYRAGLHIIALHSLTIELNKLEEPNVELSKGFYLQENESEYMTRTRISCVWIPANDAHQTVSSTVIVPYQEYKQQREFKMRLNGEDKTLVLGPAVTVQAEWVRATIASVHE
jgi:hypothetical protein